MAKEKFPGSPATLDALCRRFTVDASARTKHGALIDAELLAEVYLHMSVEMFQKNIFGDAGESSREEESDSTNSFSPVQIMKPRDFRPSETEIKRHFEFLNKLKNPIWSKFEENSET